MNMLFRRFQLHEIRGKWMQMSEGMDGKGLDRESIDALKGIGILGIILVHYGLCASNELISKIVSNGARGVQLMFVINGFLIFNSLSKIELNRKNIKIWLKHKFLRLVPLYWFSSILYLICFGTRGGYFTGSLPKISLANIVTNLLFIHGFCPYYINAININWFMADLAIFYVLSPLLFKFINSMERAVVALFIIVPVEFVLRNVVLNLSIIKDYNIWYAYVNLLSFPSEFPIMILGIVAYYVYRKVERDNLISHKKLFSIVCLIFVMIPLYSLIMYNGSFEIYSTIFPFGIIFMLVLISQLIYPIKLIKNPIFIIFGKHSYGIYLFQLFVIRFMDDLGISGGNERIFERIFGFIIVALLTLLVSIVVEEVIEKQLVNMLSYCRKKMNKKCS